MVQKVLRRQLWSARLRPNRRPWRGIPRRVVRQHRGTEEGAAGTTEDPTCKNNCTTNPIAKCSQTRYVTFAWILERLCECISKKGFVSFLCYLVLLLFKLIHNWKRSENSNRPQFVTPHDRGDIMFDVSRSSRRASDGARGRDGEMRTGWGQEAPRHIRTSSNNNNNNKT